MNVNKFVLITIFACAARALDVTRHLEHLAAKSDDILIIKGAYDLLLSLQSNISQDIYNQALSNILSSANKKLGLELNEADLKTVLSVLINEKNNASNAGKIKGLFSIASLLIILASIMIIIGVGYFLAVLILPMFFMLSPFSKAMVFYMLSLAVLLFAYCLQSNSRVYIGFTGSLALGVSFLYHVSHRRHNGGNVSIVHIILFSMWAIIAIIFQSKMIGFIAVMALEVALGYRMGVFVGTYVFGFDSLTTLYSAVVSSGFLLLFYTLMKFKTFAHNAFTEYFHNVFDIGVLSVGGFVYHLGLLILSFGSGYNRNEQTIAVLANLLMIGTVFTSFVLQAYDESFGAFRGISTTFFIFYLLSHWVKFSFTKNLAVCTVGLGLLLYGVSLYAQTYPMSFVY